MTTPLTFKTQLGLELNSLHKLSQGDEEEVSLIVLKRPPMKELHEEVEVVFTFPCLVQFGFVAS